MEQPTNTVGAWFVFGLSFFTFSVFGAQKWKVFNLFHAGWPACIFSGEKNHGLKRDSHPPRREAQVMLIHIHTLHQIDSCLQTVF